MSKQKTRLKLGHIPVYDQDRNFYRHATPLQVQKMIDTDQAVPMTADLAGELPGWKKRKEYPVLAVMLTINTSAKVSQTFITRGEMEANAMGCSRTLNLTEEKRRERVGRGLPEEDFFEKAINKIKAWPSVCDTLAVCVVPRSTQFSSEAAR